ncbi:MAG: DUF4115 domain-containing protein [Candidatus Solibacter usitatus]|nr:DUF4115 domain-containing protein [Candidatus Solibacter usitatus]
MSTLGQRLREEREKRGLTIDELAAETRINAQYFHALECDDTSALPGGFFYRSFVRQYARRLELPETAYQPELERSLEAEVAEMDRRETALPQRNIGLPPIPTGRADPAMETRRWVARLAGLVVVVVLCSAAYTFWQRWQTETEQEAAPQNTAAPATVPPPRQQPKQESQLPAAVTGPAREQAPAQAPPAAPQDQAVGAVKVIVRAKEMAWLGVWRGDKLLFGDLMRPGETRGFGAEDRLRMRLGNAGGVEVEWNGNVIPPTGPRGQIRNVEFRPDGYTVVLPQPKDAEPPARQ